jgi:hypothetical protein
MRLLSSRVGSVVSFGTPVVPLRFGQPKLVRGVFVCLTCRFQGCLKVGEELCIDRGPRRDRVRRGGRCCCIGCDEPTPVGRCRIGHGFQGRFVVCAACHSSDGSAESLTPITILPFTGRSRPVVSPIRCQSGAELVRDRVPIGWCRWFADLREPAGLRIGPFERVCSVELASVDAGAAVSRPAAAELSVLESLGVSMHEALGSALAGAHLVLDTAAFLTESLLDSTTDLRMLATSREQLRLYEKAVLSPRIRSTTASCSVTSTTTVARRRVSPSRRAQQPDDHRGDRDSAHDASAVDGSAAVPV